MLGRIIILIIIYAVAIRSSKKKSKTKKTKRDWERLQRAEGKRDTAKSPSRPAQRQAAKRSDARREDAQSHRPALERKPMATQLQMDLERAGEGEDPCHDDMLHRDRKMRPSNRGMRYQSVTQAQLSAAGEGDDPCHSDSPYEGERYDEGTAYDSHAMDSSAQKRASDSVYDSPIFAGGDQDREALARQVLSGVIMSEVLTRPAERRMQRKMRRGA